MSNPTAAGLTHPDGVRISVTGPSDTGFLWIFPPSTSPVVGQGSVDFYTSSSSASTPTPARIESPTNAEVLAQVDAAIPEVLIGSLHKYVTPVGNEIVYKVLDDGSGGKVLYRITDRNRIYDVAVLPDPEHFIMLDIIELGGAGYEVIDDGGGGHSWRSLGDNYAVSSGGAPSTAIEPWRVAIPDDIVIADGILSRLIAYVTVPAEITGIRAACTVGSADIIVRIGTGFGGGVNIGGSPFTCNTTLSALQPSAANNVLMVGSSVEVEIQNASADFAGLTLEIYRAAT